MLSVFFAVGYLKLIESKCVTFNEQLISLIQAQPLSHKLSVMEYKNDKIKDNIRKHHTMCKVMMFCCLTKAN